MQACWSVHCNLSALEVGPASLHAIALSRLTTSHHITPQDAETISLETWNRFLKEFGMLPALLGLRAAEIIYQRSFCHASVLRSLPTPLCHAV